MELGRNVCLLFCKLSGYYLILLAVYIEAADTVNGTTGCEKRNWPYPILPGNFERLLAALHGDNAGKEDSTEQEHMIPSYSFHKSETEGSREAPYLFAAVFEDALSTQRLLTLQAYLALAKDWRFANTLRSSDSEPAPLPWTTTHNSTAFKESHVNKAFHSLVQKVQQDDKTYHPYEITNHILRRGDFVGLVPGDPEGDEVIVLHFLKTDWQINSYSELVLYDEEEVFAAIKPEYNRAVVWNSSLAYQTKPPSFNYKGSMFFLMVKYTTNITKVEAYHKHWLQANEDKQQSEAEVFPSLATLDDHYENLNIGDHEIKEYTDIDGRKIHMFDDLFLEEDLTRLVQHFEHYGDYFFDDSYDEGNDNVQWISAASLETFTQSTIWEVVQKVAGFVSGSFDWFPYDLACNNIRSSDCTQMHQDCEEWEQEWTFLLYLTQNYTTSHGGETAFYQSTDDPEYITSVRPKFGRAVIFNGIIPHSARPPSPFFLGPRFSFAVKISIHPWIAWAKALKQEVAHEEYMHAIGLQLLNKFHEEHLAELTVADSTLRALLEERLEGGGGETCMAGSSCSETFTPNRYQQDQGISEIFEQLFQDMGHDEGDDDEEGSAGEIEESFIDLKEYPEVLMRKFYIYQSIIQAGTDSEVLRALFSQFIADREEIHRRYVRLLQAVL